MKKSFFRYVAVVLVLTVLSTFAVSAAGYTPAQKAQLKFDDNGEFTIMQISDIQDNFRLRAVAKKFLRYSIEKIDPDLIILTGDNIAGYWNGSVAFPSLDDSMVKESIEQFMIIFEEYYKNPDYKLKGVAAAFGNHDDQLTWTTKEEQIAMYQEYDCYIGYDEAIENIDIDGVGNYNIPIFSSDYEPVTEGDIDYTKLAYDLYIIDSNTYVDKLGLTDYDSVHENQIQWFENHADEMNALSGKEIHSMAFQHIIVPTVYDALTEVSADTEGAVQSKDGKYYVLPEGAKGTLGEAPCPPSMDIYNYEYERLTAKGTDAFFFGHDHANDFEIDYKGGKLIATSGVGFCSYGTELRGVRVIKLKENGNNVSFETYMEYIKDPEGFSSDDWLSDEADANSKELNFFERIVAWFKTLWRYLLDLWNFRD